eukprot:TRINITY_DN33749_c0_g1_i1.p1 TRINITY_DN33749_c0_g1~~TRINITY_DN33749_c0_g1_i1.p1  ORF type:complete len:698 (+),score=160.81 TRINITY_DN33749_c0_g1_i1:72-2165(+)
MSDLGSPPRRQADKSPTADSSPPAITSPPQGPGQKKVKVKKAADNRGAVFKSATQRFRTGDIITPSGVTLISGGTKSSSKGPSTSHHSSVPQSAYTVGTATLRKRYPRPQRWNVEAWGNKAECIGKMTMDARCMEICDSTIWCAEYDGNITIREKNGVVFAVVEREETAPPITSLHYVGSSCQGSVMLVGHENGMILSLDAQRATRVSEDHHFHTGAVVSLLPVYHGIYTSSLVVSASTDGTIVAFDVHTMEKCGASMTQGAPITTLQGSGPYLYSGSIDGSIKKWDIQTGFEMADYNAKNKGAVTSLLLDGKYLWVCHSDEPAISIIEVTAMVEVHTLKPTTPNPPIPLKLLSVHQHVWSGHEDGTISVWNSQDLSLVRVMQTEDDANMTSLRKVTTVPEDYEIWSTCANGVARVWRNQEYQLPIWCSDVVAAGEEELLECQREMKAIRQQLAERDEKIAALESGVNRLSDEATESSNLQRSIQNLAMNRSRELEIESDRRKRVELELAELRDSLITYHKSKVPSSQHLLHYKPDDVLAIVQGLESRPSPPTTNDDVLYNHITTLYDQRKKSDPSTPSPQRRKKKHTKSELVAMINTLLESSTNENKQAVKKTGEPEQQPAEPAPQSAECTNCEELRKKLDDKEHECVELKEKEHELKADNERLTDMLEKLKLSHKRVYAQLQTLTQTQNEQLQQQ